MSYIELGGDPSTWEVRVKDESGDWVAAPPEMFVRVGLLRSLWLKATGRVLPLPACDECDLED